MCVCVRLHTNCNCDQLFIIVQLNISEHEWQSLKLLWNHPILLFCIINIGFYVYTIRLCYSSERIYLVVYFIVINNLISISSYFVCVYSFSFRFFFCFKYVCKHRQLNMFCQLEHLLSEIPCLIFGKTKAGFIASVFFFFFFIGFEKSEHLIVWYIKMYL